MKYINVVLFKSISANDLAQRLQPDHTSQVKQNSTPEKMVAKIKLK